MGSTGAIRAFFHRGDRTMDLATPVLDVQVGNFFARRVVPLPRRGMFPQELAPELVLVRSRCAPRGSAR